MHMMLNTLLYNNLASSTVRQARSFCPQHGPLICTVMIASTCAVSWLPPLRLDVKLAEFKWKLSAWKFTRIHFFLMYFTHTYNNKITLLLFNCGKSCFLRRFTMREVFIFVMPERSWGCEMNVFEWMIKKDVMY